MRPMRCNAMCNCMVGAVVCDRKTARHGECAVRIVRPESGGHAENAERGHNRAKWRSGPWEAGPG